MTARADDHIDIRVTAPEEHRAACDAMRTALLFGPILDADWEKSAPGWVDAMSYSAWDGERCVGHVGAFRFDTFVPGGARLATAGLTRVGLLPTHTRRGLVSRMIVRNLRDARAEGRPLASLRASEAVIYARFGFGIATEAERVRVDCERVRPLRNVAPGSVRLLTRDEVERTVSEIYHRMPHRPGALVRPDFLIRRYTEAATKGDSAGSVVVHTSPDGVDDGYALSTVKWNDAHFAEAHGVGTLHELWGATPAVELALWQHLVHVDLVREYTADMRPTDDVIRQAARDPRAVTTSARFDELWVRLLDVETCLAARTYRQGRAVTIGVVDPLFDDGTDTFEVSADGVRRCGRATEADVRCEIDALSAAYLGATSWHSLAAAGRAAGDAASIARADDLFAHHPRGFCGSFF